MATAEITAYMRPSAGHRDVMASAIDGRNSRMKIGKSTRRTTPIPVLPPRIPTPMPTLPKEWYDFFKKIFFKLPLFHCKLLKRVQKQKYYYIINV